jgi:hypothetical protein
MAAHSSPDPAADILDYLQYRLPGYPFDTTVDSDFVAELLADFPSTNVLEQIKTFRWYFDNQPGLRVKNLRLSIRRWVSHQRSR